MKTNILATKQKVKELDLIIEAYDQSYDKLLKRIIYLGGERDEQQRRIGSTHESIEKLRELLKEGDGHAGSLKEEQESMESERQNKMLALNEERAKLQRQKDLLIKKIKSQQK
jgi:chromosome segregation ATPase